MFIMCSSAISVLSIHPSVLPCFSVNLVSVAAFVALSFPHSAHFHFPLNFRQSIGEDSTTAAVPPLPSEFRITRYFRADFHPPFFLPSAGGAAARLKTRHSRDGPRTISAQTSPLPGPRHLNVGSVTERKRKLFIQYFSWQNQSRWKLPSGYYINM